MPTEDWNPNTKTTHQTYICLTEGFPIEDEFQDKHTEMFRELGEKNIGRSKTSDDEL